MTTIDTPVSIHQRTPLPDWAASIRPHQVDAVDQIIDAFTRVPVVFLDGPTGSGKTLIAELVRRRLDTRGLYVCSDKQLQDQFAHDFPYAKVLKGKANYRTLAGGSDITAEDCDYEGGDTGCTWCNPVYMCPYRRAKQAAARTPELAVVNTAYMLAEANTPRAEVTAKQPFVIADEADQLEGALLGHVGFEVPQYAMRELGLDAPKKGAHKPTLVAWLQALAGMAGDHVHRHPGMDVKRRNRWKQLIVDALALVDELNKDIVRMKALDEDDDDESGRWIRDYSTKTFRMLPVVVSSYGTKRLWRHGRRWLIMSATLISPQQMADDLGLPFEFEVVSVPMTFPVEHRPVYLAPIANMTYAAPDSEHEKMADAIAKVCERHPGERVLVHTVSFKNAERLMRLLSQRQLGRRLVTYTQGREKMAALGEYRRTPGAVLLAASMARGVDLRDDDCRVVVIAKVPYPNLNDRRVSARMRLPGGQAWYVVQTIRDIVQMTGRGVRSADDYATSYILDSQFMKNTWRRNKPLFPMWWREAVDPTFNPRQLMP